MSFIPRIYDTLLREHLQDHRQMIFLSGPRQVGKTTTARQTADYYLDWDNRSHQEIILKGPEAVAEYCGLHIAQEAIPVILFDELHKFPRWKNFLKGLFDTYEERCRIIATGSAKMDVYRRGGDSLMGRYFPYRLHPLSLAELLRPEHSESPISPAIEPNEQQWETLLKHGGFPEPFVKKSDRFSTRWRTLRNERLFKEDLKDLTRIQEFSLLEILGHMLADRSGEQLIFSNLATAIQVAPNTLKAWINTLVSTHYGFLVRPWFRNVTKALRKEPKWYLRDWSGIQDSGAKAETFAACHLLKAVEFWTDLGLGKFELRYLRDKQKREVDFLVIRDEEPWFLVEVKKSSTTLSSALQHFQQQTKAPHAFQVVMDMPYANINCFSYTHPVVVPARTFFSQLV